MVDWVFLKDHEWYRVGFSKDRETTTCAFPRGTDRNDCFSS